MLIAISFLVFAFLMDIYCIYLYFRKADSEFKKEIDKYFKNMDKLDIDYRDIKDSVKKYSFYQLKSANKKLKKAVKKYKL